MGALGTMAMHVNNQRAIRSCALTKFLFLLSPALPLSDLQEGGATVQIGGAAAAASWPPANSRDSEGRKHGEDEKTSVRK